MIQSEIAALKIADRYKGNISTEDKIKWLATEVVEVAMAFGNKNPKKIVEELGDCAFLISHILSRYDKKGILYHITKASKKMKRRNTKSTIKKKSPYELRAKQWHIFLCSHIDSFEKFSLINKMKKDNYLFLLICTTIVDLVYNFEPPIPVQDYHFQQVQELEELIFSKTENKKENLALVSK